MEVGELNLDGGGEEGGAGVHGHGHHLGVQEAAVAVETNKGV